jgi:Txe/YoeB family toxin of Txe-Axe toxin-antitoxin module
MIREVLFHQQALDDFNRWQREKPSVYERIRRLIKDTTEHPFEGI